MDINIWIENLGMIILTFVGAWFIYNAVHSFIKRHFFLFGLDVMLTLWMFCNMLSLKSI